jgi:hypothetical protein
MLQPIWRFRILLLARLADNYRSDCHNKATTSCWPGQLQPILDKN